MKTINHGVYKLTTIILSSVFVFTSCTKVTIPEPSENPVLLTYEAQTKNITVENMFFIDRYDYTDKVIDEYGYRTIENEWIFFTQLYPDNNDLLRKTLKIEVKENTTGESRTHAITIGSGTKNTILTVTQAGKP